MGRKHCGKRRNCSLRAISPFPTVFSKGFYPGASKGVIVWKWVKSWDCMVDSYLIFIQFVKKLPLVTLFLSEINLYVKKDKGFFSFQEPIFLRAGGKTRIHVSVINTDGLIISDQINNGSWT